MQLASCCVRLPLYISSDERYATVIFQSSKLRNSTVTVIALNDSSNSSSQCFTILFYIRQLLESSLFMSSTVVTEADLLVRALKGETVERTPVWLMRQVSSYTVARNYHLQLYCHQIT